MRHLYFDNQFYFITRRTFNKSRLFNSDIKKRILLNRLNAARKKYNFSLYAFAIVSNHYHYLMFLEKGKDLPLIEKFIAGGSSRELNILNNIQCCVWDDYWERIVSEENALEKVLGYILGNPLKHGEVKDFNELYDYPFSSYKQTVINYGKDATDDLILSVQALDLETRTDYGKLFKK